MPRCSSSALIAVVSAGAKSHADRLTGAGSTFVSPLVSLWAADYASKTGTQIAYSPVGSGAGIAAITARQVDFGASDAPLTPDQFNACNGCVQIPWALSATSIIYNLPDVPNNLHMTGAVLAKIYLGNDHEVGRPGDQGAEPEGRPCRRPRSRPSTAADNSGTTYNFTDYLSAVSPAWKSKIGVGVNANWPGGQGGSGSRGVAGIVSNTQGAIGYVDIAFALTNKLKFMSMRNTPASSRRPGLRGITAAAGDGEVGPGDQRDAHRQPAEGATRSRTRSARSPT